MSLPILAALLLAGALGAAARADTVELESGRKLYGIVVSVTASSVEVDVGPATTTIPRSSAQERKRLRAAFEDEYFDSGRWVPKESQSIFKLYEEVAQAHRRAEQAGDVQRRLRRSRDEIESGMDGYRGVGRRLATERAERLQ